MRYLATCGFALLIVLMITPGLAAHAILRDSDPQAGAMLQRSPATLVLSFTEEPEPSFSTVHILDAAGHKLPQGPLQVEPDQRSTLRVGLADLPTGVYTVTWRVISKL